MSSRKCKKRLTAVRKYANNKSLQNRFDRQTSYSKIKESFRKPKFLGIPYPFS